MPPLEVVFSTNQSGTGVARWYCDSQPLGNPIEIDAKAQTTLQRVTIELDAAIASGQLYSDPAELRGWGKQIFDVCWKPIWHLLPAVARPKQLLIRSENSFWFNLPWGLIILPDGPDFPLGCDADWALLRVPQGAAPTTERPTAGPIRLLMMVAAPEDQQHLRYDDEEDRLLRATATVSG